MPFPTVSILVAARNEEKNILRTLQSLQQLTYPKEKLQILIGDDDSTDQTAAIVKEFIKAKPHFQLVTIRGGQRVLRGKANVLAQLAHLATGDYYFYTDADIQVPTHWVQRMLTYFKPNVGVVTGITTIRPQNLFAILQAIEWLTSLFMVYLFSKIRFPITAMGNNMAVTKEAYWETGGYEQIGFSITEDLALFKAILAADYEFAQTFEKGVMAISAPIPNFTELLIQRKRWMHGALASPWYLKILLFGQAFFLPMLALLYMVNPTWGSAYVLFFLAVQGIITLPAVLSVQQWGLVLFLPLFYGYIPFLYLAMVLNYYFSAATHWKGRTY
ncbi:MAG: glycosyltransferase [Spirosomataceae bacterium]